MRRARERQQQVGGEGTPRGLPAGQAQLAREGPRVEQDPDRPESARLRDGGGQPGRRQPAAHAGLHHRAFQAQAIEQLHRRIVADQI